ncbi:MAG: amidoligase family protein [Selenomonadaceae bacterium]|nr:amidoligase family protein [Selenomonadaceae bacterium]
MKKSTELQIENMKEQTFGVEVEMYGITRQNAAKVAAMYFGTYNYKDTASTNGYYAWSAWDGEGREWKFQRDVSINASRNTEQTELVTPILTYSDLETLLELLRQLRHAGAKSDPNHGCGVHIHIGVDDHTPQSLRNLANIMASHESILISALRIDQNRVSGYCKTVDLNFLARLNKEKPKTMEKLKDIWYETQHPTNRDHHYNPSRYHCLNLHATFTKGTIEFRLFQFRNPSRNSKGGIHCGELKSYIQLCLALSEMAKRLKTASPKEPQRENPKYAMRCWLLRLGFIGKEFNTARNVLTKNLDGDAAFRYGRNNSLLMVGVGQ